MTEEKKFVCPDCGMIFSDIVDEDEFNYRLANHGWLTPMPDTHYLACKDATPEDRKIYKEARKAVQESNKGSLKYREGLQKGIVAKGFEGKGKEQLGM